MTTVYFRKKPPKHKTPKMSGIKRPTSSYMFFTKLNREKVIAENPGIKFGQIAKKLGKMWKNMSNEEKEPYNKMAEEDKERYNKEKGE